MCNKDKTCISKLNEEFLIDYFYRMWYDTCMSICLKLAYISCAINCKFFVNIVYLRGDYIWSNPNFLRKATYSFMYHIYVLSQVYIFKKNPKLQPTQLQHLKIHVTRYEFFIL